MNKPPIVVTGSKNSGKTEFSKRAATLLGYEHINIGDVLYRVLIASSEDQDIQCRTDIGPQFLEDRSLNEYLAILSGIGRPGVILDGVRLVAGVIRLRHDCETLIHVHRTPEKGHLLNVAENSFDPYLDQIPHLESMADIIIGWTNPIAVLDQRIIDEMRTRLLLP